MNTEPDKARHHTLHLGNSAERKSCNARSNERLTNASKVFRDALIEKLEELEELFIVSDRLKQKRKRKPIAELWNELGLDDNV